MGINIRRQSVKKPFNEVESLYLYSSRVSSNLGSFSKVDKLNYQLFFYLYQKSVLIDFITCFFPFKIYLFQLYLFYDKNDSQLYILLSYI